MTMIFITKDLDDFYDQLKMSSNDNIRLILTPISEYQDSDDDSSTEKEDFVEVDFKKDIEGLNKRRIDSMDEMESDIDDESGQRKKVKVEQMNTPTSMDEEEDEVSSNYEELSE
ncbi:hypothetical protein BCR36DRAFT_184870 [Piromyces finnis]|uniref:Uncharacterized protein n=1 Tax=Piromyces finnis TaxID=1754191 RepID=A0A1Y1VH05_9FUNG|nr:hypothetical protein BCR36DRAFT_184870 [Piromyces finnis]|eukprot:ORX55363.1 hypothetical protein BCR36DRAFT_184870 [Piromyces finnis]